MLKQILLFVISIIILSQCGIRSVQSDAKPISHELWDSLLTTHVSEEGWVDYKGFVRDSQLLKTYTSLLSSAHPNDANWSREEQLAYWINAYNAFTVLLIIRHYPTQSIKDIKKGIPFVNTVWDIKFIQIEDEIYDLNNIEHSILRPKFEEPRIHFAVNCASVSCPALFNRAFTSQKIERQLTDSAVRFLADESRNKVGSNRLYLSKIFSWFKGDFTKNGSLIDFLNKYAPVQISKDADIEYLDYDWNLNEQP